MVIQETHEDTSRVDAPGASADTPGSMLVLHAVWTDDALHLWGETDRPTSPASADDHPYSASPDELRRALGLNGDDASVELLLPSVEHAQAKTPALSPRLAHWMGQGDEESLRLDTFTVQALRVPVDRAEDALDRAEETGEHGGDGWADEAAGHSEAARHVVIGPSVRFFATAARFGRALLAAQQRFIPTMIQDAGGELRGAWHPWLADEHTAERVVKLIRAMPPVVRACDDELSHDAWSVLEDFLSSLVDAECRRTLIDEDLAEATASRDPGQDPHVAWLRGLLDAPDEIPSVQAGRPELVKGVRRWIGGLDDRGIDSAWRLCIRLDEPDDAGELADLAPPGEEVTWKLSFCLQSLEDTRVLLDAEEIWLLPTDSIAIEGHRVNQPQELLLAELGRASRLCKDIERALDDSEPSGLELTTKQAYTFLREIKPILTEQGFEVIAPEWWEHPSTRLGARLQIESNDEGEPGAGGSSTTGPQLGLQALVDYHWQIAIGETVLTLREFEQLANRRAPLVRIGGRWVEIRPEDVRAALRFVRENPGGKIRVSDALRLAYASDLRETGVPVTGLDASGWVASILGDAAGGVGLPQIEPPIGFDGTLRDYQLTGLRWLVFLERYGLGACLADDMGLGKTIQLLALLQHEREEDAKAGGLPAHSGHAARRSHVGRGQLGARGQRFASALRVSWSTTAPSGCRATNWSRPPRDVDASSRPTRWPTATRALGRVPLGTRRARRGAVHQEPRRQAVAGPALARRAAPHRAHRHARGEPPQRALVDHGVPQPRLPRDRGRPSVARFGCPSSATATSTQPTSSGGSSAVHAASPQDRSQGDLRPAREVRDARVLPPHARAGQLYESHRQEHAHRGRPLEGIQSTRASCSRRSSASSRSATTRRRCSRTTRGR
jgi:hypothetical protein